MLKSEILLARREAAREKYRPTITKFLLIAEAPPAAQERFFYFEDVRKQDHLFLGVMGVLFPQLKENYMQARRSRQGKAMLLREFCAAGFYLIDLSTHPVSGKQNVKKEVPDLISRAKDLIDEGTRIIIIKVTVYDLVFEQLKQRYGSNVIPCRIPFPSSGQQSNFNEKFREALRKANYK